MKKSLRLEVTIARLASAAVAAGAFFVFVVGMLGSGALQGQVVDHGLPCLFRSATGLVCPLCGMTHAIAALGAGDIGGAFAAHPLAPFIFLVVVWLCVGLAIKGRIRLFGKDVQPGPMLAGTAVVWLINLSAFLVR
jgi:hypothetical protein